MTKKPFVKGIKNGIVQWIEVLPFIGISLILMGLFVLYPLVRNIQISMSDFNIIGNQVTKYVGIQNYSKMFHDTNYIISLRNSLLYTLVTVPGQMILGLILACLINSPVKGRTMFKIITYLPVITSWVIVSLIFKYLFMSGKGGLVNYFLMNIGLLQNPVSWLQGEWTANFVLWLFGIWKGTGWVMIIYLAALQGLSKEIYEAAQIDGAGKLKTFLYITIPMVKNTTIYLLTVLVIGAFGAYIHVMMITEGAPLGSTNELMNYMYDTAFSKYNFGGSAAQAIFMGLTIFILTMIQRKLSKETVN